LARRDRDQAVDEFVERSTGVQFVRAARPEERLDYDIAYMRGAPLLVPSVLLFGMQPDGGWLVVHQHPSPQSD
jgi:hypothetical protein